MRKNLGVLGKVTIATVALSAMLCQGNVGQAEEVPYDYCITNEEFGANGSDTEDDTFAIQSALEKAGGEGIVTIYVPAGDYYISRWLRIYSNTHLILDENATIHRMDSIIDKGMVQNVDKDGNMDGAGGYDMSENITIEGGTWDGGNIQKATDASDIIRIDHAKNVTIKNCTIKNVYDCHLVEFVGVQNGRIEGCTFTGFRYRQGKEKNWTFAREAVQLESAWTNNPSNLNDISSLWANGSVVDGTSCDNVVVTGNTFIDMPCGVGQHHYTKNGKYRNTNIEISNNTITCNKSYKYCKTAITCAGMNQVTISGNKITGPYRFGMHIEEANQITVQQNTIKEVTMNGIMNDSGKNVSITGNVIANVKKHGVSVGGGLVTTLSNNEMTNIKHDGISVDKGVVTLVEGNSISKVGKHGISITGGTIGNGKKQNTGFLKNKIVNCGANGISISAGKVSAIKENTIQKVKNNGISIIQKSAVYYVLKNKLSACKGHTIWNNSTGARTVTKGNKE